VADVSVNKGLLVGVGAVAGAALLALAYQLGKASAPEGVPAPPTKIERIAPQPPEQVVPPPARVAVWGSDYAVARPGAGPAPQPAASPVSVPIEGERNGGGEDPTRAAVAAYFDTIERIQVGSTSGSAESVGQEMASALASGDTSSLDKMIRETEAAKVRLAAVNPPAPCAAHHHESLGSLDDALEVLRSLKAAMESQEPVAQLANVSARAQALRSRAEILQKEELAIKERYGLKR
jgi:hypothetical protein